MSHAGPSLVNLIQQTNTKTAEVKAGDGATFLHYSDRTPGTVAEVVNFKSGPKKGTPRRIAVRSDNYKVVAGSQHDGSAQYEITENPEMPVIWFQLTKRGWVSKGGSRVSVGHREVWYDPTF